MSYTYTFTMSIKSSQNQKNNIEKVLERLMSEAYKICSIDGVNPEVTATLNRVEHETKED